VTARPWEIRLEAERTAQRAQGQTMLAEAARRLAVTDKQKAEAERLIALPYGAEGHALRLFVLAMHELQDDRRAELMQRVFVVPADGSHWADVERDGEHLEGPFETEDQAVAVLEASCA